MNESATTVSYVGAGFKPAPTKKRTDLPDGWRVLPLGRVLLNIVGGGTPSKANPKYWRGSIPWMTVKDMRTRRPVDSIDHISEEAIKESATNLIPKDTVIIATRVGLGKVIRVLFDVTINQDLKALIPSTDVDKGFLEYWIVSIANYLEAIGSGTTVKGIRLETLRDIPFPLAPLDQQKLIVAEIEKQFSRLDEAVAALKRIQANLKRYKASVLKAAVEGKLTEEWRSRRGVLQYAPTKDETGADLLKRILAERRKKWEEDYIKKYVAVHGHAPKDDSWKKKYKEPAAPDTSSLPELPKGWAWTTVAQIAEVGTGATPLRSKSEYYDGGRVPWVTSGALNEEFISVADEFITDLAVQETNAKLFPAHTLLVAMYGEGKTRGKVAELLIDAATNQACAAIVLEGLSSKVRGYTKLFFLKNYDDIRRLSSGGVQPNLNLSHIKGTVIPLPPIVEQQYIVVELDRRFSLVREVEAQIVTNLKRAERLRQSILKRAFSGKLVSAESENAGTNISQRLRHSEINITRLYLNKK